MALMPDVPHDLVSTSGSMAGHDGIVVHTIVGYWSGGKAAHWTTDAAGTVRQHRDTTRQSAANLDGNPRWLAIENEDHGPEYGNWDTGDGHAVPPFTDAQCEGIATILVFVHQAHGIPLELVPDTCPGRRGVAYHRQGIPGDYEAAGYAYGGLSPGGVVFSQHEGKVCPGDDRIYQLIHVIIPRARVLAGLDAPPPPETLTTMEVTAMIPGHVYFCRTETNPMIYAVTSTGVESGVPAMYKRESNALEWKCADQMKEPLIWVAEEDLALAKTVDSPPTSAVGS